MIANIVVEKFDANMEEVTIGGWHVAVGDRIEAGDKLVELITDKATFDYETPAGGTVRRLIAAPGSVVPVGYVLAQVGDAAEPLPDVAAANAELLAAYRRRQEVTIDTTAAAARPERGGRVRATPAARRLAREHGLDLAELPAAESGGIVGEDDVRAWLARGDLG